MNWTKYNNHQLSIILWSDGSHNVFYTSDSDNMKEFIDNKRKLNSLTYEIKNCMQSEYDTEMLKYK